MEVDRPAPGEELNLEAAPTPPGGEETLEVLLVRRNPAQRFMGGAWVFPGGAVDAVDEDGAGDAPHRLAGVRECSEEAGIDLADPAALVRWARWITPAQIKIRFDTHFYLAEAPAGAQARPDGHECVDAVWLTPRDALDAYSRGEIELVFPTIKTLEQLSAFRSAAAALEAGRRREVAPVQPRVVVENERARVLLPGEPGYEASP